MQENENRTSSQPSAVGVQPQAEEALNGMTALEISEALERVMASMTIDTYDEALINRYLDALDEAAPMPELPEQAAEYQALQDRIHAAFSCEAPAAEAPSPHRRTGIRVLKRVTVLAAALIVCLFAGIFVVQAAGVNVIGAIARWSDETFGFNQSAPGAARSEPAGEGSGETSGLARSLVAHGITEPMVPQYIPEGYEQTELYVEPDGASFCGVYENGEDCLVIQINRHDTTTDDQVEKNSEDPEVYIANHTEYYIMKNVDRYNAAWFTGEYMCTILNANSKELLYSMLDSIG